MMSPNQWRDHSFGLWEEYDWPYKSGADVCFSTFMHLQLVVVSGEFRNIGGRGVGHDAGLHALSKRECLGWKDVGSDEVVPKRPMFDVRADGNQKENVSKIIYALGDVVTCEGTVNVGVNST